MKSRMKSQGRDESDVNAINRGRDMFVHIEGDSATRRTGPQVYLAAWRVNWYRYINSRNANGNTIWGGISE